MEDKSTEKKVDPTKDARYYAKYSEKAELPVEQISPEDLKDIRVDTSKFARFYAGRLKSIRPLISILGFQLFFETPAIYSTICVINLPDELTEDDEFYKDMASYGEVERAFILRNAEGESKVSFLKN